MSARIGKPEDFELEAITSLTDIDRAICWAVSDPNFSHIEIDNDLGWVSLSNRQQIFYAWIGLMNGRVAMLKNLDNGLRELTFL